MPGASRPRPAATLIEVLVALGVIGVMFGLTLSAVQAARGAAARIACANHLRQVGLAATAYHDTQGALPQPARVMWRSGTNYAYLPWTNFLLPYLEQEALWQSLPAAYRTAPGFQYPPHVGLVTVVKPYTCPADGRLSAPLSDRFGYTAAYGSYQAVVGYTPQVAAMDSRQYVRLTDVTDGTSQSLLIGERPPPGQALAGNWYTLALPDHSLQNETGFAYTSSLPVRADYVEGFCRGPFRFGPGRVENPCDSYHFWSLHSGGANFLFVDGSVHFIPYAAEPILPALATRAGGEPVLPLD